MFVDLKIIKCKKGRKNMFDSNIELGIVFFLFIYAIIVSFMVVSFKTRKK
jgi:hypothetical protein